MKCRGLCDHLPQLRDRNRSRAQLLTSQQFASSMSGQRDRAAVHFILMAPVSSQVNSTSRKEAAKKVMSELQCLPSSQRPWQSPRVVVSGGAERMQLRLQ